LGSQPSATKVAQIVALIWAMALWSLAAPSRLRVAPQLIQQVLMSDAAVQSESVLQFRSASACPSAAIVALWAAVVRCAQLSPLESEASASSPASQTGEGGDN
jgi:hypothetical protein